MLAVECGNGQALELEKCCFTQIESRWIFGHCLMCKCLKVAATSFKYHGRVISPPILPKVWRYLLDFRSAASDQSNGESLAPERSSFSKLSAVFVVVNVF